MVRPRGKKAEGENARGSGSPALRAVLRLPKEDSGGRLTANRRGRRRREKIRWKVNGGKGLAEIESVVLDRPPRGAHHQRVQVRRLRRDGRSVRIFATSTFWGVVSLIRLLVLLLVRKLHES